MNPSEGRNIYTLPPHLSVRINKLFVRLLPVICLLWLCLVPGQLFAQSAALEAAQSLEQENNFSGAYVRYQQILEENPTESTALLGLLRTAVQLRNWTEARRALKKYERLKPDQPESAKQATKLHFYQDQMDSALAWARTFHERNPGNWEPFHFISQIHFERKDLVNARESISSALFRSEDNPWVLMDQFLLKLRLRGVFDDQLFQRLQNLAEHPNIFWQLTRVETFSDQPSRVQDLLEQGLNYYPAAAPPLKRQVSAKKYRQSLARIQHRLNNDSQARETLAGIETEAEQNLEYKWLRAILLTDTGTRLTRISEILERNPDNLIYQWYYSRSARKAEGLQGKHRARAADFFFREYQNNRMLNYTEAALTALTRSLEMRATNPQRQFTLAKFYADRGWGQQQYHTLRRVQALGLTPQEKIEDYMEGLDVDTEPSGPGPVVPRIKILLRFPHYWTGPLKGRNVLKSMFDRAFFHQPGFDLSEIKLAATDTVALARQVRATDIDGAIRVTVNKWNEQLDAKLKFFLPQNRQTTEEFYDNNNKQKEWRLVNYLISRAKVLWPWKGRVFEVVPDGCRVNLGRIHGMTEGDTFSVGDNLFPVQEIHEANLFLDFPSPIYKTKLKRGKTAEISRNGGAQQ